MRRLAAVAILAGVVAGGCAAISIPVPGPSGPCLEELPEIANLASVRLAHVELDVEGETEVVRFVLDPTERGFGSVTAEPARRPFVEATTGAPVIPIGDRHTSVKFEGLTGVGQADRIRADPGSLARVRDVVQVTDRNVTRFVVGTAAGACLRFRVDEEAGTVALLVSPR